MSVRRFHHIEILEFKQKTRHFYFVLSKVLEGVDVEAFRLSPDFLFKTLNPLKHLRPSALGYNSQLC